MSYVDLSSIFTINSSKCERRIARVNQAYMLRVKKELKKIFDI